MKQQELTVQQLINIMTPLEGITITYITSNL